TSRKFARRAKKEVATRRKGSCKTSQTSERHVAKVHAKRRRHPNDASQEFVRRAKKEVATRRKGSYKTLQASERRVAGVCMKH
ncbi:MAG: hypothetical protein IJ684_02100, partial [Bacteroidales bacterium]|nr:hypothetical protein [Bacteroidales bacterium]